jgi:hypothetical protein
MGERGVYWVERERSSGCYQTRKMSGFCMGNEDLQGGNVREGTQEEAMMGTEGRILIIVPSVFSSHDYLFLCSFPRRENKEYRREEDGDTREGTRERSLAND